MTKTGEKNKGGRPTKYSKDIIGKIDEYIKRFEKDTTHLPKIESFALFIGVGERTIYDWKDKHPKFSQSLDKILTLQKERLVDDGIYGGKEVNSTIVKLLLQNNHGMKEKTETDLTSGGKEIVGFNYIVPNDGKDNSPTQTRT